MESSLDVISYLLCEVGPAAVIKLSASRLLSMNHYYVMRKSISDIKIEPESIKNKTKISLMCKNDINEIKKTLPECNDADKKEILSRLLFHQSGFKHCHVIKNENKIAYMQWIIYPTENEIIHARYGKKFYPLSDKQVMIENAFTFPPYRGLGYLLSGTLQLLDQARERGYRSAVCYIRKDNLKSINEFSKMGFKITKMVTEYKFFGKTWRTL